MPVNYANSAIHCELSPLVDINFLPLNIRHCVYLSCLAWSCKWWCHLTDLEWDMKKPLRRTSFLAVTTLSVPHMHIHTSVLWLWWSIEGSTTHCLSYCDATSAKLYRSLLFPWTTPVPWRGEACYVGKSRPSCLDCSGLHSEESASVCSSMVPGDQRMPYIAIQKYCRDINNKWRVKPRVIALYT